ncbi:MAG: hypothetical protein V7756_04580 [Halopseudomonas sp.]|uniref:hypothetical protein n=1 Tax=Halopseudomonas sp. TaxID=2901191 RepID=UPI003002C678
MVRRKSAAWAALVVAIVFGLSACSPSESREEKLAKAKTLSEVVEVIALEAPAEAYTVAGTKYLAVLFETSNVTRDYHLLTTKQLMPVLLERYPEIDQFFIAWAQDGVQFLKIQFERSEVQTAPWDRLMIKEGELQQLASMYWAIPALR